MTKRECAIVMAHTGFCMLKGDSLDCFYQYLSEKAGHPVYTHELVAVAKEHKDKIREDFVNLCKTAVD